MQHCCFGPLPVEIVSVVATSSERSWKYISKKILVTQNSPGLASHSNKQHARLAADTGTMVGGSCLITG